MQRVFYEKSTFIHKLNPAVKFFLVTLAFIHMVFFPDMSIALFHVVTTIGIIVYLRPRKIPTKIVLSILLTVFSYGIINALFVRCGRIILKSSMIILTDEGIYFGTFLALRVLAIFLYSIIFVISTNPRDLIVSMVRQLKLPYRYAYAAYVSYRLAPLISRNMDEISIAMKVRNIKYPINPVKRLVMILTPLLSTLVKTSITLSLSMESRAFGIYPKRTFVWDVKIRKEDILISVLYILYIIVTTIVFWKMGFIKIFGPLLEVPVPCNG